MVLKAVNLPFGRETGAWDRVTVAAMALLTIAFLFGGASREHALRLALVELAALPLLVIALGRSIQSGAIRQHQFAIGIVACVAAVPIFQSIPLPPTVWTALPGRDQMVLALSLADLQPGWNSLSVTPDATWGALLALLPPIAMFLAVLSAPQESRIGLIRMCLLFTMISMLLGAAQLASGGDRLYLWSTTSAGSINGFFANRNHLATLLLATIPFIMVIGAGRLRRSDSNRLPIWIAALFVGLAVITLAAIRSRAGILLFAPVMVMSILAAWAAAGRARPTPALTVLVGAIGVALTAVINLALPSVLARFEASSASEGRLDRWPIVAQAAESYLPVGSGVGSFDAVYRSVEPLEQLDATFFNQAHNEYLEIWLETGWVGAALLIVFLIWFARRSWVAWSSGPTSTRDLQRASTIAILAIMMHSVVDYPLRTVSMAVLFALFCGILEFAGQAGQEPEQGVRRRRRRLERKLA